MKIGITCSTGKLGRRIYRETVKIAGVENVFPIARNVEKAKKLGLKNFLQADFDNASEMEKALKGIDVLCFISSMDPSIKKRQVQNHNVVECCKKAGVKRIVLASFLTTIGFLSEMMTTLNNEIFESGITWTMCKNGYYIEPDVRDIRKHIEEGGTVKNSAGTGKLAFTTRDELAFAYARILTKEKEYDNKTIFVHGKALTQQEFVEIVNKILGKEALKYEEMTIEEYGKYLDERYKDMKWVGNIVGSIFTEIRMGRTVGDESQFEKITGRKHVVWEKFIRENWENKDVNE